MCKMENNLNYSALFSFNQNIYTDIIPGAIELETSDYLMKFVIKKKL